MAFSPFGNSDHIVASVFIDFTLESKINAPFRCTAYDDSCDDWDGLCDYFRGFPWEDIFKLGASVATEHNIYHMVNIMSSLIHLHGFQLLVLLS